MIDSLITVLVPTSPIPSHPDTRIVDRTIKAIHYHLPESKIIIMVDGARAEVAHRKEQYGEYIRNLWRKYVEILNWNVSFYFFRDHVHQAAMTQKVLRECVTTPLVYFNEHDGCLVTDCNPRDEENTGITHPEDIVIRWKDIQDLILSGGSNFVRFYLWEKIWHEHRHLMCGQMVQGSSKFIQTRQWSGWPHVASTEFYLNTLDRYLKSGDKRMVELLLYGPVEQSPWTDFRTTIYYPEPNARRFFHMNGRFDEKTGTRDLADGDLDWH